MIHNWNEVQKCDPGTRYDVVHAAIIDAIALLNPTEIRSQANNSLARLKVIGSPKIRNKNHELNIASAVKITE